MSVSVCKNRLIEKKIGKKNRTTDTDIGFCSNDYQAAKMRASESTWFVWKYARILLIDELNQTRKYRKTNAKKTQKKKKKRFFFFENCSKIKRNENLHANTCIN